MAYFDYMMDSTGFANPVMETEEERRARLEREAQQRQAAGAPIAPVKPTPVKETITTDPVTGERRVKIEGSEADLSAMNTRTPMVSRPSQQLPPGAVTLPQDLTKPPVQPQTVPMDPTKPPPQMLRVGAEPPAAPVAPETVTPPPPPAVTQPAAVAPTPPAAPQPPLGGGLQVRPQQAEAFMPGEIAGMPSMQPPAVTPEYDTLMQGAAVNPKVRNRLITDPNTPADVRRAAIVLERRDLERQRETGAAQKELQKAVESGNFNTLARKIKQETEGGSVLKALFYKSIGMTNLALEEEKKMGAGRKWQTVTDPNTGERGFIEYDADGLPISGFDSSGAELSEKQLANFATGTMAGNLDIVGGSYVNDQTGEVGRMVTDKRSGRTMIQTDRGLKPMQGFRPQGQGGTLDMQRENQIMRANVALAQDWAELQNKVRAAGPESANRFLGEFNAKHPQHARRLQDLGGSAPQIDPMTGRDTGAMAGPAPQVSAAGRPAEGPASLSASSPSFNVGGQATAPAPATGPVRPGPATAPAPAPAPVGGAGMSPADVESAQAAKQAGMIEGEKATAEDVAKAKINNGKIIEQANTVQALTTQLLEHPGFSVSVGASAQPGFQFIPGTDKASFNAFFDQAKGQAFLAAIAEMKGLGALSDREGQAATAAVTAISLDMNEKDFRKAAHQLNTTMKRAADRNARKAGETPPFNEPDLATQAKQNREAQTWLKKARPGGKNADGTPITQEQIDGVRQRLWQRGEID
jgi:hypothetical protein